MRCVSSIVRPSPPCRNVCSTILQHSCNCCRFSRFRSVRCSVTRRIFWQSATRSCRYCAPTHHSRCGLPVAARARRSIPRLFCCARRGCWSGPSSMRPISTPARWKRPSRASSPWTTCGPMPRTIERREGSAILPSTTRLPMTMRSSTRRCARTSRLPITVWPQIVYSPKRNLFLVVTY